MTWSARIPQTGGAEAMGDEGQDQVSVVEGAVA